MASQSPDVPHEQVGAAQGARPGLSLLRSISPRTAYAAIAFLLAVLCVIAARYYISVRSELTEVAMARRGAVAQLAAATLSERLDRMLDVGASLATRVRFAELVSAGEWDAAAQILKSVPGNFQFVERAVLADTKGTVTADMPPLGTRGRNFADRDWFRGVSRDWKPFVSGVYERVAQPRRTVFAVAVPVRDRAGAPTGILVLQIYVERFFDWAGAIDVGPAGRVLVVDASGMAAFDSRRSAGTAPADLSGHPAVARLMAGASGVEALGEQLYAFMPGRHGWRVIVEQPLAEAFAARDAQLRFILLAYGLAALLVAAIAWLRALEQKAARRSLARNAERLRMLHEIDRAVLAEETPEAIAAAVVQPLRALLGVPRAIVNRFDLEAGAVEWVAAAGRRRTHVGPGVRFSPQLMGDIAALRRGETQIVDVRALAPSAETEALLASGVELYMVVPMIAGGELLGGLSFGGSTRDFPAEQVQIVREVAAQLAIAMSQARLVARVKDHAAELERRVAERTTELQATNQELEAFSYSVSHDLRAPLRAVDGYARMLEEDYAQALDGEGRRLLGVVREASRRMGRLIDDLLAFSRLGRQEATRRTVDMAALVAQVLAEVRGDSRAAIEVAPLAPALADAAMLKQVWTNLIGNALKYSSKRAEARVEIGWKEDGGELVYWVRDNGAGFDMRFAQKLFGVFQRLHRAEEFPGTGVGLAIVQRVVTRHGGQVWAEGRPGEGACFYFSLPKAAT
jgi:signal transduction histidine kinase